MTPHCRNCSMSLLDYTDLKCLYTATRFRSDDCAFCGQDVKGQIERSTTLNDIRFFIHPKCYVLAIRVHGIPKRKRGTERVIAYLLEIDK